MNMINFFAGVFVALLLCCSFVVETTLNVKDFGAVGSGSVYDGTAIQKSVEACEQLGGCTLYFPPGTYLTGPFNLTSNMVLLIGPNATISESTNESYWPLLLPWPSYLSTSLRYSSLIFGYNLSNVTTTGGGTIDGHGDVWWLRFELKELKNQRGCLIEFMYCSHVLITNVTLKNSPFWTVHPFACDDVVIRGVRVENPIISPNTDGIDPDSCTNVVIEDNYIATGDDGISLKAGEGKPGIAFARPTTNVTITNNTFAYGYGLAFGTEMSGGVKGVRCYDNYFGVPSTILRVKTCPDYGGEISDIVIDGISGQGRVFLYVNMFYECPYYVNTTSCPVVDITVENVDVDVWIAGELNCMDQSPCSVNLQNVEAHHIEGFSCSGKVVGDVVNVNPPPCWT